VKQAAEKAPPQMEEESVSNLTIVRSLTPTRDRENLTRHCEIAPAYPGFVAKTTKTCAVDHAMSRSVNCWWRMNTIA
jgi:hypothetical protein